MISNDLKSDANHPQSSSINSKSSQSLEQRTNQFTSTFLQSSDPQVILKTQDHSSSDIERSKNLIYIETKQKIEELPQDIESHYSKQLLQAKREDLIQEQIFYLEKLSDLYLEKQNWVQAAKLLNCALAIFEKNLNDPPFQTYLYTKLERIEVLFLESKGYKIPSQHEGSVLNHRTWLKNIRTLYAQKYQEKVSIQEIITFLTNSYRKLLGTLILDTQEFLGNPCTQWACIGMGSMARDEMCPYSDLEFAFLVHYKTDEVLDYFRTLSKLLELRIINMGETKFPIFAQIYGEKSMGASPTPGGFSVDSGGNTPLGKPGFYELIDTPQGLAQYQSVYWMEADIIVTNALTTTCHVAGDERLARAYNKAKEEALNKTDGFFSFTGISFRYKLALKLLAANLYEYKPNLSKEKQENNAFGIKKELYRPLQAFVGTLTLFCGLEFQSTLGMIQQLLKKGILSSKGAANLSEALNQILALRFKAHTFYQNEEEFLLHIEQGISQNPHFLYLDEQYLKTLHDIYMVLIPLQRYGEEFLDKQEIQIFAKNPFYDESPSVQGQFFNKTIQYAKAQEAYQHAISLNPNHMEAQLSLGIIEEKMGQSKEALSRNLKALALAQLKHGEIHSNVALCYNNIGGVYESLGEVSKALEFYQKNLKINLTVLGENHPSIATGYNNIGLVYQHLEDYDKANEFCQNSLRIQLLVYGENHPSVAGSYNNIGGIYDSCGDDNKAFEFYEKALKIRLHLLGENHPNVAQSYNNIGAVYNNRGNSNKALECHQKALKIWLQAFGENHPSVAQSYNHIGGVYYTLKNFNNAIEYYNKSLKIRLQVLGKNHPNVATSYNNIGLAYHHLEIYDKALEFHQKALKIRLQVLGGSQPDVAQSYNNIGMVYRVLRNFDQALQFYQKAFEIHLQVLGENHPSVATSYNNIGGVYFSLENLNKAIEFYHKALKIWYKVYGKNHPYVEVAMKSLIFCAKKTISPQNTELGKISIFCTEILGAQHPLAQELAQLVK